MADLSKLIADILSAARTAATVIPGLQSAAPALAAAEKLIGALDNLIDGATAPDTRTQAEMQSARKELAAAISAKAEATADRFD